MAANNPATFQPSAAAISKAVYAAVGERYYKVLPRVLPHVLPMRWHPWTSFQLFTCLLFLLMHAHHTAGEEWDSQLGPPNWIMSPANCSCLQVSAEALRVCEQLVRVIRPDVGAPVDASMQVRGHRAALAKWQRSSGSTSLSA
jgi:hypothetical protein